MKKKLMRGATAVLGLAAIPAVAAPVSISQTISLNDLLSGNSTSIEFNLASLLSAQGLNSGDILSGTLVAYGLSDANYGAAAPQPYSAYQTTSTAGGHTAGYTSYYPIYQTAYYSYSCGWSTCSGSYTYLAGYGSYTSYYFVQDYNQERYRDVLLTDSVADQMTVSAGGSSISDTANQTLHQTNNYGNATYDGYMGGGSSPIYYLYSRERNVYDAVYGALETSMSLDGIALADLMSDGILDATVSATVGQFRLLSAELTVWAEDLTPTVTSSVPEPGVLGLAGVALAAGALTRRRRK